MSRRARRVSSLSTPRQSLEVPISRAWKGGTNHHFSLVELVQLDARLRENAHGELEIEDYEGFPECIKDLCSLLQIV